MNTNEVNTEKLVADLKVVVHDAEELLKATAGELGEKAREARERLNTTLDNAKANCQRLEERAKEKAHATAAATEEMVRQHPFQSVGAAFGIGIIFGILLNRK